MPFEPEGEQILITQRDTEPGVGAEQPGAPDAEPESVRKKRKSKKKKKNY